MPTQYVILAKTDAPPSSSSNGMPPIGSQREIVKDLSRYNTAPESKDDDNTLYGPGIRLELPPGQDPVSQMLLTVVEEEIAWLVILRLAKAFSWKIVDMNTGRELNA